MSQERWNIKLIISRQKGSSPRHFDTFPMQVDPHENVLDAVERVWAFHDRSLCFRHACHHSTCGACGMLVNGVEKLTCITPIDSVTHDGGSLRVEPLRNFLVVSDLSVDMSSLYARMDDISADQVIPVANSCAPGENGIQLPVSEGEPYERLADCIECGCCISACPVALTTDSYQGPALLAAAQQSVMQGKDCGVYTYVDSADGVWRCHSGFECTAVCPSNVDPAWRIMNLRRRVIGHRFSQLFSKKN